MVKEYLSKIDYRLSPHAFSRPQYQVELIAEKLRSYKKDKYPNLLDVGGGPQAQYKALLTSITNKYANLEIEKGKGVNIIGSVYKIPLPDNSQDIVTLFMVLEHLSDPLKGLQECYRVLKKGGYIALTTVQYWHTHNYPLDYYRYTGYGLKYLLSNAGLELKEIWSHGGPFLVFFHVIEINLNDFPRAIFSIFFYGLFNFLDSLVFKHNDKRKNSDSLGWSAIAVKK